VRARAESYLGGKLGSVRRPLRRKTKHDPSCACDYFIASMLCCSCWGEPVHRGCFKNLYS
jgi:hypothetical protein